MKLVELRDINRGVVYVNPEHVQMVHGEGKGALLVMKTGVLIVEESLLTTLHRLRDEETPN